MPCFTYLSDSDCLKPTGNDELDKRLTMLRKLSGKDYRIEKYVSYRRSFPHLRQKEYVGYTLYYGIGGGEFQIINFYRARDWTINTEVSAEILLNYIMGVINGIEFTIHSFVNVGLITEISSDLVTIEELITTLKG